MTANAYFLLGGHCSVPAAVKDSVHYLGVPLQHVLQEKDNVTHSPAHTFKVKMLF